MLPNKRGKPNNCLCLDILFEPSPFIRNEGIKFCKNMPINVFEWKRNLIRDKGSWMFIRKTRVHICSKRRPKYIFDVLMYKELEKK